MGLIIWERDFDPGYEGQFIEVKAYPKVDFGEGFNFYTVSAVA